jgi:uncharacterized protein YjbJ (UPF0337 family)
MGRRERLRGKLQQRRGTALERAKRRHDAGVAGDALADLSRRHPDHMGAGG